MGGRARRIIAVLLIVGIIAGVGWRAVPARRGGGRQGGRAGGGAGQGPGADVWGGGHGGGGCGAKLDELIAAVSCRVVVGLPDGLTIADAYEACDVVTFPSTWEGFGNPTIESAIHRKPLVVGHYPVLDELRAFGFRWCDQDSVTLDDADTVGHNYEVAQQHFDVRDLPPRLAAILGDS